MKNKMYLSLALFLGTAQLFGAAIIPEKLADQLDNDAITTIKQWIDLSFENTDQGLLVSTEQIQASWLKAKNELVNLTTRYFNQWTIKDALQYPVEGISESILFQAIAYGSIVDLATGLYLTTEIYGEKLNSNLISAGANLVAKNKLDAKNALPKLNLLLSKRDKTGDDDLRRKLLNITSTSGVQHTPVFSPDISQAFISSGIFAADANNRETATLIRMTQFPGADAKKVFISKLGSAAAPSEGPAVAGSSTGQPQAQAQKEVVENLIDELRRENASDVESVGFVKEAVETQRLTDLNILDDKLGMNLLHWAAYKNYPTLVGYLLAHGANPEIKNRVGKTALQIAEGRGYKEIAELLKPQTGMPTPSSAATAAEKSALAQAEAERLAAEQAAAQEAERARIAAEKAEQERLAAEAEAERIRKAEAAAKTEAERQRLAAQEAEQNRLAAEAKAKADAEEEARIAAEQEAARLHAEQQAAKAKAEEEAAKAAAPATSGGGFFSRFWKSSESVAPVAPKEETVVPVAPEETLEETIVPFVPEETLEEKNARKEELRKKFEAKRADILFIAIDENNLPRVQNALKTVKDEPLFVVWGLQHAVSKPKANIDILKELTTTVLANPAIDAFQYLTFAANAAQDPKAKKYLQEKLKGLKGYEATVEGIIKRRAGQQLTAQNLREVWKELAPSGRQLTAGEVEQLVAYASDPEGRTNPQKNAAWRISTQLIRSRPDAIKHLSAESVSGLSQDVIDKWNEIAQSR